uniref:Reverse transcriptase domain-containing protein n=1 Tax=Cyprinus carpio carpio TaxID=630221 RepID=A0A9J7ZPA0_CYPCA
MTFKEPANQPKKTLGTEWSQNFMALTLNAFGAVCVISLTTKEGKLVVFLCLPPYRMSSIHEYLCNWVLDFLTSRPQVVRIANNTSSSLTLSTGAPQGCVVSPLLYSLFTYDCSAKNSSNIILKFADDTTILGLITNGDETFYRDEVNALTAWCADNNLSPNVSKTKEMIVDYRKSQREGHIPIHINGEIVETVKSYKFLGIHISEDLSWSIHSETIVRTTCQRLYFLPRQKRFGISSNIMSNFYRCTIESILTGVWYGNCSSLDRKALQRVVRIAELIIGHKLPALQDIYQTHCLRKARSIIKDRTHPAHHLFATLPSGRRLRSIRSRTTRLKNSFYL